MSKSDSFPDSLSQPTLRTYEAKIREYERAQAAKARREAEERASPERSPEAMGLEKCTECGWWRDPIPASALESVKAFEGYLSAAKARCRCTASRCPHCLEPFLDRVPTPRYYSEERRTIIHCSGLTTGFAHRARMGGACPPAS